MMRRRHNAKATSTSSESPSDKPVEPLDESDQERIVQGLRADLFQQHEQIDTSFRYLIYTAMVTCALATIFIDVWEQRQRNESSFSIVALFHGCISAPGLHYVAKILGLQPPSSQSLHRIVALIAAFGLINGACLLAMRSSVEDTFSVDLKMATRRGIIPLHHGAMAISNLCTIAFAFILKADRANTEKTLQELASARYNHKTL